MAQIADVRTLALIGAADAGKTSLAEALAHEFGAINRKGTVADGSTVSDYEAEEKEKKHSFQLSVLHFPRKNGFLEVLDTPGYQEFAADGIAALAVSESGVLCISAASPIPFHARTMWARAEASGVARAIVVTKLDGQNADFDDLLTSLLATFGDRCVPVTIPDQLGPKVSKVISVIRPESDANAAMKDRAAGFLATFTERVVEADEKLMEAYLDAGSIPQDQLDRIIPKALAAGSVFPVFFVDSISGHGVAEFAHFVEAYFPTHREHGAVLAETTDKKEIHIEPDPAAPFAGFVFKTVHDKAVGEIQYVKILRGQLTADASFIEPHHNKTEKASGLSTIFGKDRKTIDAAGPGQIVSFAKLPVPLHFGDTIHAHAAQFHIKPPEFPRPTVALAVDPKRREDEQKISESLRKITSEDPTFHTRRDPTTHEFVVEGLSELHIQIHLHQLHRRYGVEVVTRLPKIAYKETIRGKADGHYRHKKQSGGRGQFGEVYCRIEPRERGAGFEFIDDIVGGSIPRQYLPPIEKGMRSVLEHGVVAGCQVIDIAVAVYEGKFHEVDSDGISFEIAGRNALKDAFMKAKPILLEPVMNLTIAVPGHFMGAITGDLNSRRGRIMGMDTVGDQAIVKALVPLKEIQQYSTQLRSVTAGEGTFSMEFDHYDQVPAPLQELIVAEWQKEHGHKVVEE
ncbi:MAG: elongation factor G [Planctomycetes bacterium]|nr:elongation factor G [Planctomycetota bacterium]